VVYRAQQTKDGGFLSSVEWLKVSCSVHAPVITAPVITMHEVSRRQRNGTGLGVHIRVPTEEGDTRQVETGVS